MKGLETWPMLVLGVLLAGLMSACRQMELPAPAPTEGAIACRLPHRISRPHMERVDADDVVADRPIRFHMLAITWMPQTCAAGGDGQGDLACNSANRFGWTLHGLWPNSDGRPYPRYCRPAEEVRAATIRGELCRIPSVDLVQHEWAAHGTCGWDTPEAYFAQAASLYDPLVKPEPMTLAGADGQLTAGELRDGWASANPGLPREAIYIAVTDDSQLREIRLCLDLEFQPRTCPNGDVGVGDRRVLQVTPLSSLIG